MKRFLALIPLWFVFLPMYGQNNDDLVVKSSDMRLIRTVLKDNSYIFDLYIKKTGAVESILITDSTVDPSQYSASYTLRAFESLPTTPNQFMLHDGQVINNADRIAQGENPLYFLMSNNAEPVKRFEEGSLWFHIQLPSSAMFGYPWGDREGQMDIDAGTWLNIRTFRSKQSDYTLGFQDNPFVLSYKLDRPVRPVNTEEPFQRLAVATNGKFYFNQLMPSIEDILEQSSADTLDVAFVIDTTISMKEHLKLLKEQLIPTIQLKFTEKYPTKTLRLAVVFYRDYNSFDRYVTFNQPFTTDTSEFNGYLQLKEAEAFGGGDVQEAVYEGISTAVDQLEWASADQFIIQIGDAAPLAPGNRKFVISEETILNKVKSSNIKVYTILLPDPTTLKRLMIKK